MGDPLTTSADAEAVLRAAADAALAYLGAVGERPVRTATTDASAHALDGALPADGIGAAAAIQQLVDALDGTHASAGPRFFHFITGGGTPAALAADWLTSAVDQNAFSWASSPLASQVEAVAVEWLLDLFGLPPAWGGVLTTGATMANLTALAAARGWWAEQHGVTCRRRRLGRPARGADLLQRPRPPERHQGPGRARHGAGDGDAPRR